MPPCAALTFAGMDQMPAIPSDTDAAAFLGGMPDPASVALIEQAALQLPQVDLSTTMLAHGGMCARTILIPAGTLLTGALTNLPNLCVMVGDITVTTDEGPKRLTGFHVLPAAPGAKRAGIAHADTYWTTVWRTELTDPQAIEDEMTDETGLLQTRRPAIGHTPMERIK